MLVVRARKSEESEMKLECLTPEFPQGARVYSVDGVAPSLLNSASAMRSYFRFTKSFFYDILHIFSSRLFL